MAVYVTEDTRLVVQGATGETGRELVRENARFGTDVLAGVAPGRGGEEVGGVPVYGTVSEAVDRHDVDTSFVVVPGRYMKDACFEAVEAGVDTVVTIAEGAPIHDTLQVVEYAARHGVTLVGPNTIGVLSPGVGSAMLNYHSNADWYRPGSLGVVARSGSLATELADLFTQAGVGQSTVMSVGGDPYLGTTPADALRAFDDDPDTDAAVFVGEVGSRFEEEVADLLPDLDIPVFASVIGRHVPEGKKMGHAGAIAGQRGAADKLDALEAAGATVERTPYRLPETVAEATSAR